VLAESGYNTAGIAGHFYLEPLRYGFEIYENRREHWTSNQEVTSPRVTETAIEMYDQLAGEPEPFFQWVHYYDPHHDYMPHEEGAEAWNDHDRYDAEVRFTDEWVGRFVDHVEAHPRERPLVWILTADHGEGLGDHGIRYHNRNFYDELCRIPLIFQVPGTASGVIDGPVSLHDIGATVMNLAGLPPEARFEGRSLVDSITAGTENPDRLVFHQAVYEQGGVDYEIFGVSNSEWRLFWDRLNGTVELYDAVDDHREENNLELQLPEVRNQLLENLEGFLRRVEP
jgi:arylsulfatase A-like enzyme